MKPDISLLEAATMDNKYDASTWLKWGLAIAEEEGDFEKVIDIFSQGLSYQPFDAALRLQRGRKFIASGRYSQTIADISLACCLNPGNWENWYYLAVTQNLNSHYKESVKAFEECAKCVPEKAGLYPIVDWLFTTYIKMGDHAKAKAALALIDTSLPSSIMDYSYRKRVRLFKGEIPPEGFVDMKEIMDSCLKTKDRPVLEVITQLYGLSVYYAFIGDIEKSNEALLELLKQPFFHNGFGYIKGVMDARERGLI